mmetsp:Transcript_119518/g.338241  ORF Transcript_119518/g.338241 Transcript_119518/m.338241 type:complete len:229 (-) Transcript_119518:18-704(-)
MPCPWHRGAEELGLLEAHGLVAASAAKALSRLRATAFHVFGDYYPEHGPHDQLINGYYPLFGPREKVPLCEDLRPGVLTAGEKCYSKCGRTGQEDCIPSLLPLVEGKTLEMIRHPTCKNHFECVGPVDRVLCEARYKPSPRPDDPELTGERDEDEELADLPEMPADLGGAPAESGVGEFVVASTLLRSLGRPCKDRHGRGVCCSAPNAKNKRVGSLSNSRCRVVDGFL